MKPKICFLFIGVIGLLLTGSCTEVVYKHHSDFDYSRYPTAFLYAVTHSDSYFYSDDQETLHNYFLNKLNQKSSFTAIYNDSAHHSSTDCKIELIIKSIIKTEQINEEGDRKIEMSAEMEVIVTDNKGVMIVRKNVHEENNRTLDKFSSSDEINTTIYDLSYEAVEDCLNTLSSLFLKDLEI